jgi:hypothetical protein
MATNEIEKGCGLSTGAVLASKQKRRRVYPFAILFRELSAEQKGKLLERAQHWPEPLAKQVAKMTGAAAQFRGPSNGFREIGSQMVYDLAAKRRFGLRFNGDR